MKSQYHTRFAHSHVGKKSNNLGLYSFWKRVFKRDAKNAGKQAWFREMRKEELTVALQRWEEAKAERDYYNSLFHGYLDAAETERLDWLALSEVGYDRAHEIDMERLRKEQLRADISLEEANKELLWNRDSALWQAWDNGEFNQDFDLNLEYSVKEFDDMRWEQSQHIQLY
jgi:hypothetical protein